MSSSSPTTAAATSAPGSKPASPSADSAPGPTVAQQQPQAAELGVYVDTLIKQLQSKFDDMSGHIISKIDTMADRLDDLEKSIAELMQNAEAAAAGPSDDAAAISRPASVAGHGSAGTQG
ncbi:heat shock factor binding protein 1-domain-containing protein [Catenaria anguillulae PL171]|uniref:Heat shock factor binding protein 1-domain-containing protein n=1 Tax=Catenaria anguillulae PL171 TaxID=765915 RepID=A0A1Y2HPZ3_9FUNG|nr:heat shock factor binding protein 1-domain-containing protein [Catenaria anguillulae PL171]